MTQDPQRAHEVIEPALSLVVCQRCPPRTRQTRPSSTTRDRLRRGLADAVGDRASSSVRAGDVRSSSSAVGPWPSDHSSRSSEPASRRANQSLPNSSRRKSRSCASNAHERRYDVT